MNIESWILSIVILCLNSLAQACLRRAQQMKTSIAIVPGTTYATNASCVESLQLKDKLIPPDDGLSYCRGAWDQLFCWEYAAVNETLTQNCPDLRGLDISQLATRTCGPNGYWMERGSLGNATSRGWTNYSACYTKGAKERFSKIFGSIPVEEGKAIALKGKRLTLTGSCLSFISLILSLFIFFYFRSLRCDRTRIHRNLFIAILIHVSILLMSNIDYMVARSSGSEVSGTVFNQIGTIYNTPLLCETQKIISEYTKTVMFVWMFIEGMYLHNMLVVSVFSGRPNYALFYIMGWGMPILNTLAWAITSGFLDNEECWFLYSLEPQYWILEGPRAAIIAVNMLFLLNIIRVLVTKLRESHSNEAEQVRKAVKAAIVLVPLLGITNSFAMVESPRSSATTFAIWTYTTNFLTAFQGFFIALLYCFLNTEVQERLKRSWYDHRLRATNGYLPARTTNQQLNLSLASNQPNILITTPNETQRRADLDSNHRLDSIHDSDKKLSPENEDL